MTEHRIDGTCDPAFQSVADAFAQNFETDDELGAAVAVTKDGELVVDLWGGHRDAERQLAWEQDTIVCMMSVGKAVSSLCIHMLADRGQLDLDAPVSQIWPAFAQNGKREIPVKWVLSHLSSVPVADAAPRGALYDWNAMTEAIAKQAPLWKPGTTPCYHTATQGFILGEILRNVTGQTLGEFVRNEISRPLRLDYQIGLTPAEEARCATMIPSAGNILSKAQSDADSLLARGWAQLPADEDFNSHRWRACQIPSANGHGNARAIARLYGLLALGGAHDGVRLLSREGDRSRDRGAMERARPHVGSDLPTWHGVLSELPARPADGAERPRLRSFRGGRCAELWRPRQSDRLRLQSQPDARRHRHRVEGGKADRGVIRVVAVRRASCAIRARLRSIAETDLPEHLDRTAVDREARRIGKS